MRIFSLGVSSSEDEFGFSLIKAEANKSQFLTLFGRAPEDCPTMGNGPDLRNKNTVNNVNEIRSGMIFVHLLDNAILNGH